MPLLVQALYNLPPIRRLLAAEAEALLPELSGMTGAHGLLLAPVVPAPRPPTPMLGCWTHMRVGEDGYDGDVRARCDEPLPFQDDAFRVIVLSHALECVDAPGDVLAEAARVLAPDGLLALTGVHPASAWSPWMVWRGRRGGSPRLTLPLTWRQRLARHGIDTYAVRRFGEAVPSRRRTLPDTPLLPGGGYLLLARKRRLVVTPLRQQRAARAAVAGTLASGAHRECA